MYVNDVGGGGGGGHPELVGVIETSGIGGGRKREPERRDRTDVRTLRTDSDMINDRFGRRGGKEAATS